MSVFWARDRWDNWRSNTFSISEFIEWAFCWEEVRLSHWSGGGAWALSACNYKEAQGWDTSWRTFPGVIFLQHVNMREPSFAWTLRVEVLRNIIWVREFSAEPGIGTRSKTLSPTQKQFGMVEWWKRSQIKAEGFLQGFTGCKHNKWNSLIPILELHRL